MEGTAPEATLEAGDEEIDWDHTRMLSLGFFPSILTDQVRDVWNAQGLWNTRSNLL